jgi:hypothetical protein
VLEAIDGPAPERAHQDIPPSVARFVWHRDGGCCRVPGCRSARGIELHHVVHRADGGSHEALNLILACSSCHGAHHAGRLTISGTADHLEVRRPGQPTRAADARDVHAKPSMNANASTHETPAVQAIQRADAAAPIGVTAECVAESPEPPEAPELKDRAHVDAKGSTASDANVPVGRPSKLDAAILRAQAKAALTGLGWKPALAHAAVASATAASQGAELTLEQLIRESLRRCPTPKA